MGFEILLFSLSFLVATLGLFVLFSIYRQWRWGDNAVGLFGKTQAPDQSVDAAAMQRQLNAVRSAALSRLAEDEDDDIDEDDEPLAEGSVSRSFGFSPVHEPQEDECQ